MEESAWESGGWNDLPGGQYTREKYLLEYENDHNTNITVASIGRTFDKAGGAASVLTGGSGAWSAWTDSAWITLSRANGEAGVSCIYAVGANFSADTRMGRIYIEDKVFTVTQTGYMASISPESAEWNCAGGSGEIEVTVDALTPIRERYNEIRKSQELIDAMKNGTERANAIAEPVIQRAKERFGLGI